MWLVPAVSENHEFEASFGYITKPCLKIKTKGIRHPRVVPNFWLPGAQAGVGRASDVKPTKPRVVEYFSEDPHISSSQELSPLCPHLALTATESDGTPLMEQYVPCPVCETSWSQHADPNEKSEGVQYFDMEDCVLTAIEQDFISCPRHPEVPVPLQELVPELFMTDFPARYAV